MLQSTFVETHTDLTGSLKSKYGVRRGQNSSVYLTLRLILSTIAIVQANDVFSACRICHAFGKLYRAVFEEADASLHKVCRLTGPYMVAKALR